MRRYLRVGDRKERRRAIERIRESRISQLDSKHYQEVMRRLESQEKVLRYHEARLEGRKYIPPAPGSRLEQIIHDEERKRRASLRPVRVTEMTPEQKAQFDREQEQMWGSIPKHMRERAEAYSRGEMGW